MAIYAISDLHLAVGVDKPMDIFGSRWSNYMERLRTEWINTVKPEDYVIIPGDISWATYLEQAVEDFRFIEALPGRKIISKGNHDYWWTTASKLRQFLEENGLKTIEFLHNNSFDLGEAVLCGTRGWDVPGNDGFSQHDGKIYKRELQRLELSLKSIVYRDGEKDKKIIAALHFPPFSVRGEPTDFNRILSEYGVSCCIYGHLHGEGIRNAVEGMFDGVRYILVSSDHLAFKPLLLVPGI